jgi:hypothetical protein
MTSLLVWWWWVYKEKCQRKMSKKNVKEKCPRCRGGVQEGCRRGAGRVQGQASYFAVNIKIIS